MEYDTHLLQAIELNEVTRSFRFSMPPGFKFEAGQFFYVRLSEKLMKHFSFSNSPTERGYVEFTTKITGSEYKNALNTLNVGSRVRIRGPFGEFTYDPRLKKIAFLSGGIGITPVRSICKYITDGGIDCDITVIYGNRTESDIIFKKDFELMEGNMLKVVHVLSNPRPAWSGHRGYITRDIIVKEIPDYMERTFYACGPPAMVLAMTKMLDELNVDKSRIMLENFTGY